MGCKIQNYLEPPLHIWGFLCILSPTLCTCQLPRLSKFWLLSEWNACNSSLKNPNQFIQLHVDVILNKKCGHLASLDRQFVYTFVFLYLYLWLCICICAMECFKVVSWSAGGSTVMSDSHSQRWALYSLKHSHRWALPSYSNTLTLLSSAFHFFTKSWYFQKHYQFLTEWGVSFLGTPFLEKTGNFKKNFS